MMAESLESRKHDRKPTFDVPLPMRRKEREASTLNESWTEESASPSAASGTMAFSLLTKRGNRQQVCLSIRSVFVIVLRISLQTRTVALPSDSTFAIAMKTQQAAEREEQQRIKNLVLNYDLREGDDLDGDSLPASFSLGHNINAYKAGLEKAAGSYPRPDKSSNNRSGQRARKLQLSDVDWYDPEGKPHSLPLDKVKNISLSEYNRGLNTALKQQLHQTVNSGRGFSVTAPRQPPQSSRTVPRTRGKGRLTRREILQEHASRNAALKAAVDK